MTMPYTTTLKSHNMFLETSKEKIFTLLRQKAEEIMNYTDAIKDTAERYVSNRALHNNLAKPILKRCKASLVKVAETSKIGLAGIFAGVFCIFFSLIYTMVCYANRRE